MAGTPCQDMHVLIDGRFRRQIRSGTRAVLCALCDAAALAYRRSVNAAKGSLRQWEAHLDIVSLRIKFADCWMLSKLMRNATRRRPHSRAYRPNERDGRACQQPSGHHVGRQGQEGLGSSDMDRRLQTMRVNDWTMTEARW